MSHSYLYPPAYERWLSARLPGQVTETLATCESCAMVRPEGLTRDPGPFAADLKCCTYFPFIPNFTISGIESTAAARVRLRVAESQGLLLPLGLFPPPERETLMLELGDQAFGQRRELLCPLYDTSTNACSSWENRPAVCTTYFCKSNRGFEGLELWQEIERYLNNFEWVLANEVFRRLGGTDEQLEMCQAAMASDEPGLERELFLKGAWGPWGLDRSAYFEEAAQVAAGISPSDLTALMGDEYVELEREILARV